MNLKLLTCLILLILAPSPAFAQGAATRVSADSISSDAAWSGDIVVERQLRVARGAVLTIRPGSEVRFVKGAGLVVEGVLKAAGKKGSPVVFTSDEKTPSPGDWTGISFNEAQEGSMLKRCSISYAGSISMAVCSPPVQNCEIQKGVQGIVLARKARPAIEGNVIRDMREGGVHTEMGSAPAITGNTIDSCGQYGILSGKDSHPAVKGNTISGCMSGLTLSQVIPPVENNVFKGNNAGLQVTNVGNALEIRGNKFLENEAGVVCQQFANPLIEKNLVKGNRKEGIVCFRAASPRIRNNEIADNEKGIVCVQLCNPVITANDIHDNKKGIYLDLSSYAVINGNNIYANETQLELGNMSSDWERRVNKKPERGSQAQNMTMASRGRAPLLNVDDGSQIMGYVDATGNWWGGPTTEEMETKGAKANIRGFMDYYDVPTRTYEGYSGLYVQDRIKYDGWKKSRIKGAGL